MTRAEPRGGRRSEARWLRSVRLVAAACCAVIGVGLVLVAVTVGDCTAFGGRCPRAPEPLLDDDTFRFAALGATIAVGGVLFFTRSTGAARALAFAMPAGLIVGYLARSIANA